MTTPSREEIIQLVNEKLREMNPQLDPPSAVQGCNDCGCFSGISSLQLVELLIELEDEFGIEINTRPGSVEEIVNLILKDGTKYEGA